MITVKNNEKFIPTFRAQMDRNMWTSDNNLSN